MDEQYDEIMQDAICLWQQLRGRPEAIWSLSDIDDSNGRVVVLLAGRVDGKIQNLADYVYKPATRELEELFTFEDKEEEVIHG